MDDEPFSAEYFTHLLSLLILNSRTLITELTSIAERNTEHASEIALIIEERLKKCLPKYKLFTIYLIDSICKNIGNPYNLIFGSDLYRLFTETYLVVTDSGTRQDLINLFKTWTNGKTNLGQELFQQNVIQKIEQFIIKATSISQTYKPNIPIKLIPDMLLREANCLLQYIIMLNNDIDNLPQDNVLVKEFVEVNYPIRNNIISAVNAVSDSILGSSKQDFDNNVNKYHIELQNARKSIDEQSFQQGQLLNLEPFKKSMRYLRIAVKIDVHPDIKFFDFSKDLKDDSSLISEVQDFGKDLGRKDSPVLSAQKNIVSTPTKGQIDENYNSHSIVLEDDLGMGLGSINFMESFLGSPKNETTDPLDNEDVSDGYDPEPTNASSLKRKNSVELRTHKKVRFDV